MSSVYNYTFTGFGTRVSLVFDGKTEQTFCTGASVSFNQKIMNSNGSFGGGEYSLFSGGKSKIIQANGSPRMDIPQVTVSLNFQMTVQLIELFFDMIQDRKKICKIIISGAGGEIELKQCYWNKINLQVSQNSLMTGSIDFTVVQEYETIYGFIMFARNSQETNKNNFGLFGTNFNCHLIPYYATAVIIGEDLREIQFGGLQNPTATVAAPQEHATGNQNFIPIAWTFDVSQNIILKTFCKGENINQNGYYPLNKQNAIAFGLINSNINITTLVDAEYGLKLEKLYPHVKIKNFCLDSNQFVTIYFLDVPSENGQKKKIRLNYLQLQSATPNYADASNFMSCQLNYQVNKISFIDD